MSHHKNVDTSAKNKEGNCLALASVEGALHFSTSGVLAREEKEKMSRRPGLE